MAREGGGGRRDTGNEVVLVMMAVQKQVNETKWRWKFIGE